MKTNVPNGNVEVLCKVFKWSVESVGPMSGAPGLGSHAPPPNALASPAGSQPSTFPTDRSKTQIGQETEYVRKRTHFVVSLMIQPNQPSQRHPRVSARWRQLVIGHV